jgi:predicted acyl esterase
MPQVPVSGLCSRSLLQWTGGVAGVAPCTGDDRLNELTALSYTLPAQSRPLAFNGPITANLWVKTTGGDPYICVRLVDVAPDGSAADLTDGWLLASRRAVDPARSRMAGGLVIQPWHPFSKVSVLPVPANTPLLMQIEVFPTDAVIKPGHSLRLVVQTADFPHAFPTPAQLVGQIGGVVTVLHDQLHPSDLVLPVVGA